jgi:hypothetical protein
MLENGMDAIPETQAEKKTRRRRWWPWLLGGAAFAAGVVAVAGWAKYKYLRDHADQILRDRVVASLTARFHSPVTLDSLHLDVAGNLHVTGTGLKILYVAGPERPDADPVHPPPMISVDSFEFQTDFKELFQPTTRIVQVNVRGLQLDIPPHGMRRVADGQAETADDPKRTGQQRISLVVGKIVCTDSRLVIETNKPGKLPLVFHIANITLTDVGAKRPLTYDATLTNPKPIGNIHAVGHFGPWQADEPRDTPTDGDYVFTHADLATFKGIAGILSSNGHFAGTLSQIAVKGETDTPEFRLDLSDHPVPLHTEFQALVDGTTGDTTLKQVDARLQKTMIHCSGSVYRVGVPATGVTGHDIELSVAIDRGRLEDLLTLATKTSPPILQGYLSTRQHLSIPPGRESVAKRMRLGGSFHLTEATFGSPRMQTKVDEISMRAQGRPEAANERQAALAVSTVDGAFTQARGKMEFSSLNYMVPGAAIRLKGWYTLEGNAFDFSGVVRTEATASQMTTGWKSMLLKAVDPLLKKNGAGLEVPIVISGTKADPKFKLDMKKMF